MEDEAPEKISCLHYCAGEVTDLKKGEWTDKNEWRFELETGEFPLLWAAMMIRLKYVGQAETTFENYKHAEVFNIDGKNRIYAIGSGLQTLREPLLINSTYKGDTEETRAHLAELVKTTQRWRMKKHVGEQAIASIGWYADITKARPPAITKEETTSVYQHALLPENMIPEEEKAATGYNKKQSKLLEEGRLIVVDLLRHLPNIQSEWDQMGIVVFGQRLSKLRDKVFASLPDPEEEERKKLEELQQKAKEMANPDD
jgi:hypothetical protein